MDSPELLDFATSRTIFSLQESRTFLLLRKKWKFPVLFSREILLSPRTFGWKGKETVQLSVDKSDFAALVIRNLKLWWPNGYGEPNLYTCKLTCSVDGKISDEKDITFGIKKYEYKMINNVVNYPVLTFFINGQKIYLKGGNWGMSEYLLRCHGKEYETKIKLHKDMN